MNSDGFILNDRREVTRNNALKMEKGTKTIFDVELAPAVMLILSLELDRRNAQLRVIESTAPKQRASKENGEGSNL